MMQQDGLLLPGERLDDLQRNGYKIIQNEKLFCFGMDAVLLSAFARVKEGEQVLDLGTGTGVIPILLEAKSRGRSFAGLEICAASADMARRSVAYKDVYKRQICSREREGKRQSVFWQGNLRYRQCI